jgi:hypothetical protein
MLLDYKYFLKTPENYQIMSDELNNIEKIARELSLMVRRKWYWLYADYTGEISFINRGVIRIPEEDNALFFSLSRAWGIYLPSSKESNKMSKEKGFTPNGQLPISKYGKQLGYKVNRILKDNETERELFYPMAQKLAFHQAFDIYKS